MKLIKETKEVIVGYEAGDGTRFSTKEECENYEKTAKFVINQQWEQIAHPVDHSYTPAYVGEDDVIRIIDLSTPERMTIANMYAKQIGLCDAPFKEKMLGSKVAVLTGYDDADIWGVYTRQQMIDLYMNFINDVFGEEDE